MSGVWVFGYGSLVSPASFGFTLGRELTPGVDFVEAEVGGYGRRWNYGVAQRVGRSTGPDGSLQEWTMIALGVVASADETVNGVIGWVEPHEIAALDLRERNYDRVDVSATTTVHADIPIDAPIVTYVPRTIAMTHYRSARDRGEAAVAKRYWDLVDAAFDDLGPGRRERYHATTPRPDVPIVEMVREESQRRWDAVRERVESTSDG